MIETLEVNNCPDLLRVVRAYLFNVLESLGLVNEMPELISSK